MPTTIRYLGADPGWRPGTRIYDSTPVIIKASFPPFRQPISPIKHYEAPRSTAIGPIQAGGIRAGARPLPPITGGYPGGLAANQAALDRAKQDAARQDANNRRMAALTVENTQRTQRTLREQGIRDGQRLATQRILDGQRQIRMQQIIAGAGQPPKFPNRYGPSQPVEGRKPTTIPRRTNTGYISPPMYKPQTYWGGVGGLPQNLPVNRASAPESVLLLPAIKQALDLLLTRKNAKNYPENTFEISAMLVYDDQGNLGYRNMETGVKGATNFNRDMAVGDHNIGTIHVHSTDEKKGFSAVDMCTMLNERDKFSFLNAGGDFLMLMRTDETVNVQFTPGEASDLNEQQGVTIANLRKTGLTVEQANLVSCNYLAERWRLVLYKIENGKFVKVPPAPPYAP